MTIEGLKLVGGGIFTDSHSHNNIIDQITALYVSQVLYVPGDADSAYYEYPQGSGIMLNGTHNIVENSTIAHSATNGVVLMGSGNSVTNSLIHDIDWLGDYSSGVEPVTDGNAITHDTIYNTGRSAITFFVVKNLEIGYNNLFNAMLLSSDGATIYSGGPGKGSNQATGTRVHDNWLHSAIAPDGRLPPSTTCNCPWSGMYMDGSAGVRIDHNVNWDSYPGIFIHGGRPNLFDK